MKRNCLQNVVRMARFAAFLFSLVIPVAETCAQTQAGMNAPARTEFVQSDDALLAKLTDAEGKEKLKHSQRAWLAFRDAEAAFAAGGGSMAPTIRYETMTELTQQRIKQLKSHLEE